MLWLAPGFRDFAETSMKTFLSTIFVLFVHVVILQLASSLFSGMATTSNNALPDTLIAMVAGIATILTLLKVQGVMMQFSFVSMGARNLKKLGGQFMNGVSYMTGTGSKVAYNPAREEYHSRCQKSPGSLNSRNGGAPNKVANESKLSEQKRRCGNHLRRKSAQ